MGRIPVIIALTVLVLLIQSTAFLTQTYAFGPTCQYSNVTYNYPTVVIPNQEFAVSISLPAVCPQTNNYHLTARFDVENSMNRVLASNYTQDGFVPNNGKPFTFIVTNDLTAPSTPGPWHLQFVVYAFMSEDDALGLDYKVQEYGTIQVGQPFPLQTSNKTATSTATHSPILSTTTFPTTAQSTPETVILFSQNQLYEIIAAIIAAVIALLLMFTLLIRRKTRSEGQAQ